MEAQPPETSEAVIAALITHLKSKSAKQRTQAAHALNAFGVQAIGPLLNLLQEEAERKKKQRPVIIGLSLAYFSFFIYWQTLKHTSLFWELIPIFIVLMAVLGRLQTASGTQIDAIHILAGLEDFRAVGFYIDALEFQDQFKDSKTRSIAANRLIHLLPHLRATDAHLLTDDHRKRLYRHLSSGNKQLTLAILKALEQIGASSALPYVEKIAAGKGAGLWSHLIEKAAKDCLPYLQERARQESTRQTLLRAADTTGATAETLLRSANETPESDPTQLLRVATRNEEG